ncbi:MAG: hypothetical protein RMK60_09315 [Burkholderiales bacterium]|nr:hypothetical protein [Burkholderiales bacterium]
MTFYDDLTKALRAALMMATRGYIYGITFEVAKERMEPIGLKWAEAFGTGLPPWKRHQRKLNKLPNAWACAMPVPGSPGRVRLLLMRTEADLDALEPGSPWRREKWQPWQRLEIGDFVLAVDQRPRGDRAMTIKLSPRCVRGLERYWRSLADVGNWDALLRDVRGAVRFYPMFGGVRRQLRRLLRGYAKLYTKKTGNEWPGPNPDQLPVILKFDECAAIGSSRDQARRELA